MALRVRGGGVVVFRCARAFTRNGDASRRGGGAWEQIAVLNAATFEDQRPPLVPGQPEQREYRVQGYQGNARVGDVSSEVSVVTQP